MSFDGARVQPLWMSHLCMVALETFIAQEPS